MGKRKIGNVFWGIVMALIGIVGLLYILSIPVRIINEMQEIIELIPKAVKWQKVKYVMLRRCMLKIVVEIVIPIACIQPVLHTQISRE